MRIFQKTFGFLNKGAIAVKAIEMSMRHFEERGKLRRIEVMQCRR